MAPSPLGLSDFPEGGIVEHVAGFLKAPDLLSFLSAHPTFRRLGWAPKFWNMMNEIQYPSSSSFSSCASTEEAQEEDATEKEKALSTAQLCKKAKDAYLLKAHCHLVPKLHWYAVNEGRHTPSDREGHLACRLGNYIVVTGGFTQDSAIYVKDIRDGNDWQRILPDADSPRPEWAYGASLTALDETRAVRFGGFRAGGYAAETPQVCVLHLTKSSNQDGRDGGTGADQLRAHWEIVLCRVQEPERGEPVQDWPNHIARAYHATILLQQRYLMVVGGMQSEESILNPLLLDTLAWTWHVALMQTPEPESPAPRHGCSLIHDAKRQKLLLFGGGSGSDLLRSGEDYPDVWEADMTASTAAGPREQDLLSTLPWKWNLKIRQRSDDVDFDVDDDDDDDDDEEYVEEDEEEEDGEHVESQGQDHPNNLSPAERLNLGRCHGCYHIADDTCLLAFGGRPSTNSVLGYRLDTEEFFRPVVQGPVPEDRFTFASVHLLELGYLVFHGGYSCRSNDTLSSTCVLDLAPGMQRPFQLWPIDRNARSHPVVTDEFAQRHQSMRRQAELNNVISMLWRLRNDLC